MKHSPNARSRDANKDWTLGRPRQHPSCTCVPRSYQISLPKPSFLASEKHSSTLPPCRCRQPPKWWLRGGGGGKGCWGRGRGFQGGGWWAGGVSVTFDASWHLLYVCHRIDLLMTTVSGCMPVGTADVQCVRSLPAASNRLGLCDRGTCRRKTCKQGAATG